MDQWSYRERQREGKPLLSGRWRTTAARTPETRQLRYKAANRADNRLDGICFVRVILSGRRRADVASTSVSGSTLHERAPLTASACRSQYGSDNLFGRYFRFVRQSLRRRRANGGGGSETESRCAPSCMTGRGGGDGSTGAIGRYRATRSLLRINLLDRLGSAGVGVC